MMFVVLALYLGEIVRLIIVDLVQRSILLPGRMQKTPSLRSDYNIFLILRGKMIICHPEFRDISVFNFQAVFTQNMWQTQNRITVTNIQVESRIRTYSSSVAEDLSVTSSILTSIGIHDPSYDDCYLIREVCRTVSLRAAKLAAAGKIVHLPNYI